MATALVLLVAAASCGGTRQDADGSAGDGAGGRATGAGGGTAGAGGIGGAIGGRGGAGGAAGTSGGSGGTAGAIGGSGGAGAMDGGGDAPSGDAPTDAPVDGPSCPPGTVACGGACVPTAGADASVTDAGSIGSSCDTGEPGVCVRGTQQCRNGAVVCVRAIQPAAEICDGLDSDCDGVVDNGNPGGGLTCSTGNSGVCAAGTTACSNGAIACNQNRQPSAESCNGLDDDCNGVVDNGNPGGGLTCNTGNFGVCAAGTTACSGGAVVCNQNTQPSAETCDGLDNDCDGVVDNGNPGGNASCSTGKLGVCATGTTACSGGAVVCNQNTQPSAETCDGLDNDCSGAADNGNPGGGVACNTGKLGVCAAGTTACSNGGIVCNQNAQPSAEACDGQDNDCDGVTDNGNPGGNASCSTGKLGVCAAGTTACSGGAVVCNQNVQPSADNTCNGVDENCDGYVDEGSATCGSCGTPFSIPAGGGAPSFQMNGNGTASGSCGGGGVDRYHVWTPAKSGIATISLWTINNWYPAVLYVRSGSCSGGEVACDTKTGDWPNPAVTLSVTAGTSYYIIADHGSYNGPIVLQYTLTVTPPP